MAIACLSAFTRASSVALVLLIVQYNVAIGSATAVAVEAVLSRDFGSPLSVVLARARVRAAREQTSISRNVGQIAAPGGRASAFLQAGSRTSTRRGFTDESTADASELVRQLSQELQNVQSEIDMEYLNCNQFKVTTRQKGFELQGQIDQATQDVSGAEANVAYYAGELQPTVDEIGALRSRLKSLHEENAQRRWQLVQQEVVAHQDLSRMQTLKTSLMKSCQTGTTMLLSCSIQEKGQLTLEVSSGEPHGRTRRLRKRRSKHGHRHSFLARRVPKVGADAPEAHPRNETDPLNDKVLCPSGTMRPTCPSLSDYMDDLEGHMSEKVMEFTSELTEHDSLSQSSVDVLNHQIEQKTASLVSSQTQTAQAEAKRSTMREQMVQMADEMKMLVARTDVRQQECQSSAAQLERECCGLIRTRQAAFWELSAGASSEKVIHDCEVGDWSAGPCSTSCVDGGGQPGQQVMTRSVIYQPAASSQDAELGSACPATKTVVTCGNVPCPIDCEMSSWSGWARCSRECGGGEQYRSRHVLKIGLHGGQICPANAESRDCNVQACSSECTLGSWGAWGSCSRQCRWTEAAPAGHSLRLRPLPTVLPISADCPDERARSESRECGAESCVGDVQCTTNQDIVVLLDGSASLQTGTKPHRQPELPADHFFLQEKGFAKGLIQRSTLSGAKDGVEVVGARYAVVVFGGTTPHVASILTGNRQSLETGLTSAAFPAGETKTGEALQTAIQVLQLSETTGLEARHETVVLVTDGRLRQQRGAVAVAKKLKVQGVRVIVVLVQGQDGQHEQQKADEVFCGIASMPCSDNVLRVDQWTDLTPQLNRFVSAICPGR